MGLIHEALAEIAAEVPSIEKRNTNKQQGFQYRGIDDIYAAVHPLLTKHGVFSVPCVETERSEERTTKSGGSLIYRILGIRYDFFAKDGSSISAKVIGEGMDSGDKAANKAMAVAHKYALLQILSIPIDDIPDPDGDGYNLAPKSATRPPAPSSTKPAPAKPAPPKPVDHEAHFNEYRERMRTAMGSGYFSDDERDAYAQKIAAKGGTEKIPAKDYYEILRGAEAEQEAREALS